MISSNSSSGTEAAIRAALAKLLGPHKQTQLNLTYVNVRGRAPDLRTAYRDSLQNDSSLSADVTGDFLIRDQHSGENTGPQSKETKQEATQDNLRWRGVFSQHDEGVACRH